MKNSKIDFVGIGAQKAGTTWLFKQFDKSNQITLPPKKELHYFDRDLSYPSPNLLTETFLKKRLRKPKWILRAVFEIFKNMNEFKWYVSWFFSDYDDNWYLSLFEDSLKCKGEITPSYAILREEDVKRMSDLLGRDTKIIFMLRNPIDRAWSSYKYRYKVKGFQDQDFEKARAFIESDYQIQRSEYLKTIQLYRKYFDSICIGFFDAIIDNPKVLLTDIFKYLNIDHEEVPFFPELEKKVNTSKSIEIPDKIYEFLYKMYINQISELSNIYGGYFNIWKTRDRVEETKCKPTIVLN